MEILDQETKDLQKQIVAEERRSQRFQQRIYQLFPAYERQLHALKSDLKGNIRVFCRVRPLIQNELGGPKQEPQKVQSKRQHALIGGELMKPGTIPKGFDLPSQRKNDCIEVINSSTLHVHNQDSTSSFSFDVAFNKQSSQEDVFYEVQDFVRSALDGFKVNVFAYGQTGSGKTYTM